MSSRVICKACGHRGHVSARCPTVKPVPSVRPFTVVELWFFAEPRTWPEITSQFRGPRLLSQVTDSVIHHDSDGGLGHLDWSARTRSWFLTDAGRALALGSVPERSAS